MIAIVDMRFIYYIIECSIGNPSEMLDCTVKLAYKPFGDDLDVIPCLMFLSNDPGRPGAFCPGVYTSTLLGSFLSPSILMLSWKVPRVFIRPSVIPSMVI